MNISIVGAGYLGLTTAVVFALAGHKVYCVDIDESKIEQISKAQAYFFENGLPELLQQAVDSGRLLATTSYQQSISNSEVSFVCVNTPSDEDGRLSLNAVDAATRSIATNMQDGHIVVMKSTVSIGTHKHVCRQIESMTSKRFHYVSNPEFLAEGTGVLDTFMPDRIVVGTDDDNVYQKICDLYQQVDTYARTIDLRALASYAKTYRLAAVSQHPFSKRVVRVSIPSAELIKVTANSYLATKISFANAIANIAERCDADINQVMDGIGMDPRIGRDFLYAGLGWGGGCFPKDIRGLITNAADLGYEFELLKEVENVNFAQAKNALAKAVNFTQNLNKPARIAILGLAFKPGTDDVRYSPAINLVSELLAHTDAHLRVYDPKAGDNAKTTIAQNPRIYYAQDLGDCLDGVDLIVLATEWPEFVSLDFAQIKSIPKPKILDTRNRWDKQKLQSLGFEYVGIGR